MTGIQAASETISQSPHVPCSEYSGVSLGTKESREPLSHSSFSHVSVTATLPQLTPWI